MLILIDNYDSFAWNLVQYFGELGEQVTVLRNDAATVAEIDTMSPSRIVISPGPCTPDEAGVSLALIAHFAGTIPILGVCLGHQAIAQVFGGRIVRAHDMMHGKTSLISHDSSGVFRGVPDPFEATRYHSLVVDPASVPACLDITAWSLDAGGEPDEIMGLRHREFAIEGVQFHPEAILTRHGHDLLRNFLVQEA